MATPALCVESDSLKSSMCTIAELSYKSFSINLLQVWVSTSKEVVTSHMYPVILGSLSLRSEMTEQQLKMAAYRKEIRF